MLQKTRIVWFIVVLYLCWQKHVFTFDKRQTCIDMFLCQLTEPPGYTLNVQLHLLISYFFQLFCVPNLLPKLVISQEETHLHWLSIYLASSKIQRLYDLLDDLHMRRLCQFWDKQTQTRDKNSWDKKRIPFVVGFGCCFGLFSSPADAFFLKIQNSNSLFIFYLLFPCQYYLMV